MQHVTSQHKAHYSANRISGSNIMIGRADALIEQLRFYEAINELTNAIELWPDNALAYYSRGVAFRNISKSTKALIDLDKAALLGVNPLKVMFEKAKLQVQMKNYILAIEELKQIQDKWPDNIDSLFLTAQCCIKLKRFENAISCYNKIIEIDAGNEKVFEERADLKEQMNEYEGALYDYLSALKRTPQNAQLHFKLGMLYAKFERYEKAISCFTLALDNDTKHLESYFFRAFYRDKRDDYAGAISDYTMFISLSENCYAVLFNRALAYFDFGKYGNYFKELDLLFNLFSEYIYIEFLNYLKNAPPQYQKAKHELWMMREWLN
jgi:tetratricopeptide (TPR) repeat protein